MLRRPAGRREGNQGGHDVTGDRVPYTVDIAHLLGVLSDDGLAVADSVLRATGLTPFAVHNRYPGLDEPVEEPEYLEAVEIAEAVVRWAEGRL